MAATTKTATAAAAAAFLLVLAAIPATTYAQSPAEAPGSFSMAPMGGSDDCINNLLNMSDCLTYVEAGSKLTAPEKGCCPELAGLIEGHPLCLCQLLADPEKIIGVKIEMNKALKLPSACKIDSPPVSLCSVIGMPIGAPTPAASEGPMASSANAMTPGGLASSPSSTEKGDKNAAPRMAVFDQLHLFVGFAAMVFATLF